MECWSQDGYIDKVMKGIDYEVGFDYWQFLPLVLPQRKE